MAAKAYFRVSGPGCPLCDGPRHHSRKYDATCCLDCQVWLEETCGGERCSYCSKRPDIPPAEVTKEEA